MEPAWLVRLRWRRRGAWLWPVFIALTAADAVIGHLRPPSGDTETLTAAGLLGCLLNLIAVLLLSRPLGAAIRRRRRDLPGIVARNYGGTVAVLAVAIALTAAGLIHRPTVLAHQRAMRDAISRAQAWIGDRAPPEFRRNVEFVSTYTIEPGSIYRTCVPSPDRTREYCVIVKMSAPFPLGVSFDGYEPNSVFAQGLG
jgi:hypothetical protein